MAYSSPVRLSEAFRNCCRRPRTGAWRARCGLVTASVSRWNKGRRHIARLLREGRFGTAHGSIAVQPVVARAQAVSVDQEPAGFPLAMLGPRRAVEVHAQRDGDLSAATREAFEARSVTGNGVG
jgi:hypothetical protein